MPPRKIVFDTDPGVDDAMALYLALASEELEVLGLTTVFGNHTTEVTTRNALALLQIAGREDIPVVAGAKDPVAMPYLGPVAHVHGDNGLGNADLPEVTAKADEGAARWMFEQAAAHPGEVTLLAVGPLTNLAVALERHPEIESLVQEVVVMGGNALVPGNATPAAEANMLNDPEAADRVFGASWKVSMIGLDVTHEVIPTGAELDRLATSKLPATRFLSEVVPFYRHFFESTNGIDGIYMHDPTAVVYLIAPELFTSERWALRVETEGMSRGKTWPSLGGTDDATPSAWRDRPRVTVCTGAEERAVIELTFDRLL
ncbi:MAG: nucleoside hydrolase [Acidobacteriota bacterium]